MRPNCVEVCFSVILLSLITTTTGDDWTLSCTSNCTCKWTNGKKSAICSSLQLTTIPTTLSTELQVLVLNENHIPYLNREEFINLGLLNLQRVYLRNSNVQYLHKDTFSNLRILVEIDLSDNRIETLDKDTFAGNDRLRIVLLNGNPLKQLVAYQFPILPHLRTLYLQNCTIDHIDPMAFANLNMLEYLALKNNRLESLSEYVFQHMTNLKTLNLDENPWQCDCRLRKFRNWYVASKVNSVGLACKGPALNRDKRWDEIDDAHFGCHPKVEIFNNDDVQNIDIGANTTFGCLVYGDPLPEVTWELNGKNFDNDNILFDTETVSASKLWSNLTVFNMTSLDGGRYTCSAQNVVGADSQNISIYLTEIVQHVLVKTPETFWYFGLIMGTFGTVFFLMLLSLVVCLCKRTARRRRHPRKNMKGSVSFNDQEKKLLDLSITTTTNDRADSSGVDNTPSINKTESVIGFEPIEITVENHGAIGPSACPPPIVSVSASASCGPSMLHDEFPLNVGVFPPPPEFCSSAVPSPAYGNFFISVSVTHQDNIYPDLLNIPNRENCCASSKGPTTVLPVTVSPFATLPRNQRRGILKKDAPASQLYAHDEIVSYHNLDTSYSPGYHQYTQAERAVSPETSAGGCMNCSNFRHPVERQPSCLMYDNMGRRITASGNSTLSLPDDEQLEDGSNPRTELPGAESGGGAAEPSDFVSL